MKKTILVTGGAGFIGSNLIESLLTNDYKVVCVDNFSDFYDPKIKLENIKEFKDNPHFKLYRIDIENKQKLKKIFVENKIDLIIHLAARAGVRQSILEPDSYVKTNIYGTLNLLELTKDFKIKKFIFASSSSVYGNTKIIPFSESIDVNKPISPYAATKLAGEHFCYTFHHLYDIQMICLRFFTVYGPKQRPDLAIYKFTKLIDEGLPINVYGDGTSKRDYTYIEDIFQGIYGAISYDKSGYEIINLGENNTVSLSYLIELIEKNLGKKAIINRLPLQPGDVDLTFADISKARGLLGYNPKTKIEDGIAKFVKWYKKQK